jgi:hypothetical protein
VTEGGDLKSDEIGFVDLSQSSHPRPRQLLDAILVARQRRQLSLRGLTGPTKPLTEQSLDRLDPGAMIRHIVAYLSHGAYRDRTGDLRLAKPALSQLS